MEDVLTVPLPYPGAVMSAAFSCATEMLYNSIYMRREIPKLVLAKPDRKVIEDLCDMLTGTKHDIVTEVEELRELVACKSTDPATIRRRVKRIEEWISEDIRKMHAVVERLDELSRSNFMAGSAYLLVAESATNIIKAFVSMADAASAWRDASGGNVDL